MYPLRILYRSIFMILLFCGASLSPALSQNATERAIEEYNFLNGIELPGPTEKKAKTEEPPKEADKSNERYDQTALNNVPYEKEILRISEIMGAMHFLNQLCPSNIDRDWRKAMGNIINTERAAPKYRKKLTIHFNRGFLTFQTNYKSCTLNAKQAIVRYVKEGAALSKHIVDRYGRQ